MRAFEFLTELDVRYGAKRHTIGDIYGKKNLKVPKAKYKDKRTNKQKGIFKESVDDGGDCFESALQELLHSNPFGKEDEDNMTLVHAVVTGQGEIEGLKHGHAWNEIGDVVIDKSNGRNIVMRKEDYYKAGNINPNNTNEFKRYTRQEMSKMVSKFKTYGPWELPNGLAEGFAGIPDYKTMPAYKLKKASKGKHKFFLPTDAPVPASVSALDEYKLDNERGLGSTPNNSNVDYMGFRTMMKPSVFLKLAKPLPEGHRSKDYPALVQKIKSGEGIGSPFLSIEIPDGWEEEPADFSRPTVVTGHEGRHRMNAIIELEGDVPVEVHLWGRFEGSELRRRYITDEMFDELQKGLISETGQYIVNPFLSIQR